MKKVSIVAIGLLCMTILFPQVTHAFSVLFGASLFSPRTDDIDYYQDATILYVNPGSVDRHFTAPVYIPHGAHVTSVVLYFKDNSPAYINLEMKRLNIFSNKQHLMCSYSTEGSYFDWQAHKITMLSYRDINNNGFLYFISVWFSEGQGRELGLRAVKIHYDLVL